MIEEIKKNIINNVNPSWTNIQKIRYAYLALGKAITKDADFFISAQKKFESKKLSFEDLKEIYNSKDGRIIDDKVAVICRSSCYMLHDILQELGIQSKVLKTKYYKMKVWDKDSANALEVYHYILEVKDKDKYYLMALSADLPYIHNGMKTEHFGSDIPFSYKRRDGSINKIYDDGEDNHDIINDDDLRDIDEQIGYLKYYYNYNHHGNKIRDYQLQYDDNALHILRVQQRNNNLYYSMELKHTDFYKELYTFKIGGKELFLETSPIHELPEVIRDIWIRKLCIKVTNRIQNITHKKMDLSYLKASNWSYYEWLKAMCETYKEDMDIDLPIEDKFSFKKWSKNGKKNTDYDYYDYNNALAILDKTNAIVNLANGGDNGKFNDLFNKLGYHFIDKEYVYNPNNVTSKYIEHKFFTLFPFVFSANELNLPFNKDSYAEQSALIKEIIELLFPELNVGKNSQMSPVFNRIQLFTVQNNQTGKYDIVFNIAADKSQGDQYFLYNISENRFNYINIIKLLRSREYSIISERLQNKLTELDETKKR